jgi:hemoglobin/transferrin/lactoferrin receptor protein
MRFLTISLSFFICFCGFAQQVLVKDAVTLEVLPSVTIVDLGGAHFETTDFDGSASLDAFTDNARISFSHIGYLSYTLSKNQIKSAQIIWMTPDTEQLGEIVLSVARASTNKKRLAQQVGIVAKAEIEKQSPENTAVLLRKIPGVRVQQSQGGGGSPVLRGFEANRVLLVVDGVRMNNAIFRSGHLHNALSVDPLSLERAEVIFGPSSVGYGSDALGGVIHFYTRTPLINQNRKISFSGSSSYDVTQNTSKQSALFEYSASKWSMLQYISYAHFGDIVMGKRRSHGYENWGKVDAYSENTSSNYTATPTPNSNPNKQRNTGYEQVDLLQKWVYHSDTGLKFTLNLQGSSSGNIPRFDRLAEKQDGELRFARWEYGPQKRWLISPQLNFIGTRPWLQSGKIIAAAQFLEESRIKRKFSSLDRDTQRENLGVYSLNADFKARFAKGFDWSYGFELTHNEVKSTAFSQTLAVDGNQIVGLTVKTPIATRYPSGGSTYSTFAAYMDFRYDINPNSTLAFGARHTFTELDASWTEQALIDARLAHVNQKNGASNLTLGYTHQPNAKWQLKALMSTGFRAPNIDDLGKTREHNGVLTVPNMKLSPEYIVSAELGIKRLWKDGSFFELNGYYANIYDYIARGTYHIYDDPSTPKTDTIIFSGEEVKIVSNTNLGRVSVYGFSAQTQWQVSSKLHYSGALTLTKGDGNNLSGNLPSIPPLFTTQKVEVELKKGSLGLEWNYAKSKDPSTYSPWGEDGLEETPLLSDGSYAGTPAWHRFDLHVAYPINPSFNLSGGVFNLFDAHYKEFASGISVPGRSLKLVLRYQL